eukprot:scaffold193484_cov20-Prasinocladus_malaysianus.AAC.1
MCRSVPFTVPTRNQTGLNQTEQDASLLSTRTGYGTSWTRGRCSYLLLLVLPVLIRVERVSTRTSTAGKSTR